MPTLPVSTDDGVLYEYISNTWAHVRALGTTSKSIQANSNETIDNSVVSGRGSAANNIGRYYFKFNSVKANSPPNEPLANTLNEIETLFLEVLFTPTE